MWRYSGALSYGDRLPIVGELSVEIGQDAEVITPAVVGIL